MAMASKKGWKRVQAQQQVSRERAKYGVSRKAAPVVVKSLATGEVLKVVDGVGDGRQLSRTDVRVVACPECGAAAGNRCFGVRGARRTSNHMGRVKAAQLRVR